MTWMDFARTEWRRRPLRTSLTAAGVAIGIAAMGSLLSFEQGYRQGLERELDRLGAHILVVPKGCPYDAASIALHGASWPCYLKAQYLEAVRATPGVGTAAPALMAAFYDAAGQQTVYLGIDARLLALKRSWRITGSFPERPGDLLVGCAVAERLGLKMGQSLALPGLPGQQGVVRGTLAPTQGPDDTFIFMPLADAQKALHRPGELTHILVRLDDPNHLEAVIQQLRGCDAGLFMNVVPVAHLFRTIQGVVRSTRVLLSCLVLAALLVAGAGVGNTLLMAVAERTREIGVLRAVGASRAQIFQLFWLITVQVCLVGGMAGVLAAWAGSSAVEAWVRSRLPFAPQDRLLGWHWWIAGVSLGSAVVLGTLAGLLPAGRAASLPPIEAMRQRGDPA